MIIGTGVDIVEIKRFKNMQEKTRFMQRVFSVREQDYLAGKDIQSMAGLFAVKEAVAKALGTGFRGFFPCDIEILHDKNGRPIVRLHGRAKATANKLAAPLPGGIRSNSRCCCGTCGRTLLKKDDHARSPSYSIHISISHNQTDAIAFAVLYGVGGFRFKTM